MALQVNITLSERTYQQMKQFAQQRSQNLADAIADYLEQNPPLVDPTPVDEEANQPKTIESADDFIDLSEPDESIDREMNAYIALHPTLKEKFLGQHVAIYGKKVIDHDRDYGTLYERVRQRYPHETIWFSTVKEEPIETVVIRSPRLLKGESLLVEMY